MSERIIKFLAMAILAPILFGVFVFVGCLCLLLPIVALISPEIIKFKT